MQAALERDGRQVFTGAEHVRLDDIFAEFDAAESELIARKGRLADARARLEAANGSDGNRGRSSRRACVRPM